MKINIIVATDLNSSIGQSGSFSLPWKIKDDLSFFKSVTLNKCVVMGRNTFESIGSKSLPNRCNIVISSTLAGVSGTFHVSDSIASSIRLAESLGFQEVFFIGGAKVINSLFSENFKIDTLFLTLVSTHLKDGDSKLSHSLSEILEKSKSSKIIKQIEKSDVNEFDATILEIKMGG